MVVGEVDDFESDDISELVDSATPIYNYDILKMYINDSDIVDDYRNEMGGDGDSVQTAQGAYYMLIERLARDVMSDIVTHNNEIN